MFLAKTLPLALASLSLSLVSFPAVHVEGKGGGGSSHTCPDPDTPPPICMGQNSNREWCVENGGCDDEDEDCCCVHYHVNYCGNPSGCNPYLQCVATTGQGFSTASDVTPSDEEMKGAFGLLFQAAEDAAAVSDCPSPSEGSVSSAGKSGSGSDDESTCPKGDNVVTCHETHTRGECVEKGGCDADDDDCCCVAYTVPYCGVPSDCNEYLNCYPSTSTASDGTDEDPAVVPDPPSNGTLMNAFEFLEAAKTNAAIADACPEPASAPSSGNALGFSVFAFVAVIASVGAAVFVV